jgi:arsenite methyltransferase
LSALHTGVVTASICNRVVARGELARSRGNIKPQGRQYRHKGNKMAKLEFDDEGSRLVEAINTVPDTIRRRQAIMRALNLKTGERVLDVGSGPGHQVLEMSPMVGPTGKVDGVDISKSMLQIARSRCDSISNIEFHEGDVVGLPFPEGTFNAVMSSMVFEYLPDVPGALKEVHRVLKPGGRVAIHGCAWGATLWRSGDPGFTHELGR